MDTLVEMQDQAVVAGNAPAELFVKNILRSILKIHPSVQRGKE
jgi:hypothetical protein